MSTGKKKSDIIPRAENFSQWYLDIIDAADLAEHADVRGAMIIKPYGFAIWELLRNELDQRIKATGHHNAYFPLFIPKSFFDKEAEHAEGFAKEMAIVTHTRLKKNPDGDGLMVDPASALEEPLVVRPTSETVIHAAFARWVHSWRDLPILMNQWVNVVRWELRTRLFLRTTEFLWQEGHTAHATQEEAHEETMKMLNVYEEVAEQVLAMPVAAGEKSASERFPGAEHTFTIEAMMQDGKALQAGTSHDLGQRFSRAFGVKFLDRENQEQYCWLTSWGVSTRIIGGLIMTHSDDAGLVLPPNIAPYHVVILPIIKGAHHAEVDATVTQLQQEWQANGVRVHIDHRDYETLGNKIYEWEKKGVPLRCEVGPRDIAEKKVMIARRDTGGKEAVALKNIAQTIVKLLEEIQHNLFMRAKKFQQEHTRTVDAYDDFKDVVAQGFAFAWWCGKAACEERIKEECKATNRCIPFNQSGERGQCVVCGQPSQLRAIFSRAY